MELKKETNSSLQIPPSYDTGFLRTLFVAYAFFAIALIIMSGYAFGTGQNMAIFSATFLRGVYCLISAIVGYLHVPKMKIKSYVDKIKSIYLLLNFISVCISCWILLVMFYYSFKSDFPNVNYSTSLILLFLEISLFVTILCLKSVTDEAQRTDSSLPLPLK